jgi:hypothetical protein
MYLHLGSEDIGTGRMSSLCRLVTGRRAGVCQGRESGRKKQQGRQQGRHDERRPRAARVQPAQVVETPLEWVTVILKKTGEHHVLPQG